MFKIPRKMYKLLTQTTDLFIHQPKYPLDMDFKRKKTKQKNTFQQHPVKHIYCYIVFFSNQNHTFKS